ncbi:MAG: hypothetical protein HOQ05_01780 [Corynebacteriales bacterium]|nr:hypothetical protein [Mycobacteriales bacterium]
MRAKVLAGVAITAALALILTGCGGMGKKSKKRKKSRTHISKVDSGNRTVLVIPPADCSAADASENAKDATRVDLDERRVTMVSAREKAGNAELSYNGTCGTLRLTFTGKNQVQAGDVSNDAPTAAQCETAANRNTAQSSDLTQNMDPVCVITGEGAVLVLRVTDLASPRNGAGDPSITLEISEPA